MASGTRSRRARAGTLLAAAALAGCALSPVGFGVPKDSLGRPVVELPQPEPGATVEILARLRKHLDDWIDANKLARDNGYIYGVDIGQALVYAAQANDRALYDKVRPIVDHLVIDNRSDRYTQGFLRWRWRPGEAVDASGTAEALWVARGLWLGAKAFGRSYDRHLALRLIDGYERHEFTEAGTWYVRNYFNFGTRSFATNSYTVNYMPDFLDEVAADTGDAKLVELARKSRQLLLASISPGGMVNSIVQPEVATIFPDLNLTVFSPNGIVSLFETCGVVEMIAAGNPAVAARLLEIVDEEGHYEYYNAADGKPYPAAAVTFFPSTCLLRLALILRKQRLIQQELPFFVQVARAWASDPQPPRLFTAGQLLMTLAALDEHERSRK